MSKPSFESTFRTITAWNLGEHRRMHGTRASVFSDLEGMRVAAALDYDDLANSPVIKSLQHVQRLGMRVRGLQEAEFDPEYTGRTICDCLKLMSGMQAKRAVATADNGMAYRKTLLRPDRRSQHIIAEAHAAVGDELVLATQFDELEGSVVSTLKEINARAKTGEDWGHKESPMVAATVAGEIACARMAIAIVSVASVELGGIELVPLRQPAKDGDYAENIYPFRAA